ncbi:4-(cytidine 5'-diphospho)-2-C-methyl-D-erythritol kinase [Rhizobacter sp. OV335]|uniref:4-(cytidine 5'-diphospho)-2-C-methyl-D-erythritol kinase n=1 Tax=Rhizobacter sp. OV335 TaxID=1500264 RepID=UPI000911481A|nr:4-(cytidine 5'-diphospho)-2-C-methyl-D-erythritol kinase [Rhizobacter sp. OV335]SHM23225.1 4-diphosphocytidyl-2-C-methyl-D-erythritol kinase [Rhizobacter sp. OV335]
MSLTALYDVPAPAKLNLFLHIIGRRDDGYHLLQSVFVLIDWADTLHIELRRDGQLARHDLSATLPADDLCLRAARALQAASGTPLGADISIDKQVPWGAGMGGGSSDAASTLLALNRLWQLNWPREQLMALGLTLGADVPFFLGRGPAWVEGIGEKLTPLELPAQWLAVVKPAASIETRGIFLSPLLVRNTDAAIVAGFLEDGGIQSLLDGFGRNDLQPPAESQCSEVAQAARLLEARFGNSRMTGSGSAVFSRAGILKSTADVPTATMPTDLPSGWVGRMCRSLVQHPLQGW